MNRGNTTSSFTGYTKSNDPTTPFIKYRPAKQHLGIEHKLNLVRGWFGECLRTHTVYSNEGNFPVRLIDTETRFPIRTVRLRWSEEGEIGPYVALSYCWGGMQSLITKRETAQDFTDGIPASMIPKTLLDAINITHELGLRYIWIDALCIIQNDPEDVAREVGKMAEIYQQACITISAACAGNVDDGFLAPRSIQIPPSVALPLVLWVGVDDTLYFHESIPYSDDDDPIHLRA